MSEFDYRLLNDIIHSRIRLAIMSILVAVKEAEFTFLKKQVNTTDGNISVHLKKLEDKGYITVQKSFLNRKPVSTYSLTDQGHKAFTAYVEQLEKMIKK